MTHTQAQAQAGENPYLEEAMRLIAEDGERKRKHCKRYGVWGATPFRGPSIHRLRDELTAKYAWAIPDEEALAALAKCAPLAEIGAGTGYWAWLLRARGVDILAYDKEPPEVVGTAWTEVLAGGPEMAGLHAERTLLLCWPPYGCAGDEEPMADDCLRAYEEAGGQTVAYVGEDRGCTGDAAFADRLDAHWHLVERVYLPHWPGVHDALRVFKRGVEEEEAGE